VLVKDGLRMIVDDPVAFLDRVIKRFVLHMDLYRPGWYTGRITDWKSDWMGYVRQGYQSMVALSCLVIMLAFYRRKLFWAALTVFFVYMLPFMFFLSYESRIRWPVDHFLLLVIAVVLSLGFFMQKIDVQGPHLILFDLTSFLRFISSWPLFRAWVIEIWRERILSKGMLLACLLLIISILFLGLCRAGMGRPNRYALLNLADAKWTSSLSMNDLPENARRMDLTGGDMATNGLENASLVVKCVVSNYSPGQGYKYIWPPPFPDQFVSATYSKWALCFQDAVVEKGIREGDEVEILGHIISFGSPRVIRAGKVKILKHK